MVASNQSHAANSPQSAQFPHLRTLYDSSNFNIACPNRGCSTSHDDESVWHSGLPEVVNVLQHDTLFKQLFLDLFVLTFFMIVEGGRHRSTVYHDHSLPWNRPREQGVDQTDR